MNLNLLKSSKTIFNEINIASCVGDSLSVEQ